MGNARNIAFWVVLFVLILALFNLFSNGQSTATSNAVSYSELIQRVSAGQVQKATLDGEKITATGADGGTYLVIKPEGEENPAQYWQRFEQSWHWRKEQFDQGLVEVTVADTEPTDDSASPEDGLEIPQASDTFNDYKVLTGWGANA